MRRTHEKYHSARWFGLVPVAGVIEGREALGAMASGQFAETDTWDSFNRADMGHSGAVPLEGLRYCRLQHADELVEIVVEIEIIFGCGIGVCCE